MILGPEVIILILIWGPDPDHIAYSDPYPVTEHDLRHYTDPILILSLILGPDMDPNHDANSDPDPDRRS